jgi:hypothetical protein
MGISRCLSIPVFALALGLAGLGCGGNGAGRSGAAGSMGDAGGAGGAAGAGGAGGAGGAAGAAGAVCPDDAGMPAPACGADAMSPAAFCTMLLAFCCPTAPGYTTMDDCLTTYTALGTGNSFKQLCESQHLCNAANDTGGERAYHCSHAVGEGPCNF